MSSTINSNISSLTAQRNLGVSQGALATSMQRLSSGLRINSAKDDAAGMAIAQRFTSQVSGLNQATRNANDAISLSQTAEGALGEVTNNLQRIRELSIQSANATNSASDRAALQSEVSQRIAEISRVGTQTQFNGLNLLDGSFTSQAFQVGANANQTISIASIGDTRSSALGSNVLTTNGSVVGTVTAASATVNGIAAETNLTLSTTDAAGVTQATSAISYALSAGANVIAGAINTASASVGVTAVASNTAELKTLSATGTLSFTLNTQTSATTPPNGTFTAVSSTINATITNQNDLSSLVSAINGAQSTTGITADFTTAGNKSSITLSTLDGRNIGIGAFSLTGGTSGATDSVSFAGSALTEGGTIAAVKTGTIALTSSRGAITAANGDAGVFNAATSSFESVAAIDISTATGAQTALGTVDAALRQVSSSRAELGAYQNRFDSVITNLQTTSENLSASRSRIQDADFAAETANLSRAQILQQAGTAMVAQANQLPQGVLALLR
jgi:flagellin